MEMEKQKELKERILFEADGQKLPCKQAFAIAAEVDCPVAEVGKAVMKSG
jgi:hypothetical protein